MAVPPLTLLSPVRAGETLPSPHEPIIPGTPAYRRLSLALVVAGFATFALLYGVQPLLPLFAAEFQVSAAQSSLVVSMATGAMAFTFIPIGVVSDRVGRVPIITASLFGSSLLTLLSAFLPGWHTLLLMRALTGIALAGLPAIAMAYVAEEVDGKAVGSALGLYIGGSAIGGMLGRFAMTVIADVATWRWALAAAGAIGLGAALVFRRCVPPALGFTPMRHTVGSFAIVTKCLFRDAALPWLFAEGFLLMGVFVTIYNYAGFRLQAPPYSLGQAAVGAIFLVYIVGSVTSAWFGGLADRVGRRKVLWIPIVALAAGGALTAAHPLAAIIAGIIVVTIGFFAAHSTASSWVGRRASEGRAQAASLYMLFYYLGSSFVGSAGGLAWTWGGWPAVATFAVVLSLIALGIALRLMGVPPIRQPEGTERTVAGPAVCP